MTHSCDFPVSQVQKQNYRQEKKRAARELFTALKDPSVVIMSNWLKVQESFLNSIIQSCYTDTQNDCLCCLTGKMQFWLWVMCHLFIHHPSCNLHFICYEW